MKVKFMAVRLLRTIHKLLFAAFQSQGTARYLICEVDHT